ncbi:MAG TPA: hypothetical protein VKU41_10920, partial [Polyangiaceae bacterium]|nr:hypothetical protein [Polyangiaceae bacterium]
VRSATGHQLLSPHFVSFHGDGTAPSWPGAYFDDAKNWALVSAIVGDPQAHVTHVFVAAPLRARLLAYADHAGVPAAVRMHAAELMQQPHGTLPHDDHFHVRIGCPPHQSGCVENPPMRARAGAAFASGRARRRGPPEPGRMDVTTPAPTHPALPPLPPPSRGSAPQGDEMPPASATIPVDDVDG